MISKKLLPIFFCMTLVFSGCSQDKIISFDEARKIFNSNSSNLQYIVNFMSSNKYTGLDSHSVSKNQKKFKLPSNFRIPNWLNQVAIADEPGTYRFIFKGNFGHGTEHGLYYSNYPKPDATMRKYYETVFKKIKTDWYYYIVTY